MKKSVILALLFATTAAVQLDVDTKIDATAPVKPIVNTQVDASVDVLADHTDPMDSYIDEDEEDV
jgi:hypothetical protein